MNPDNAHYFKILLNTVSTFYRNANAYPTPRKSYVVIMVRGYEFFLLSSK